jgi:hypothetical protein
MAWHLLAELRVVPVMSYVDRALLALLLILPGVHLALPASSVRRALPPNARPHVMMVTF